MRMARLWITYHHKLKLKTASLWLWRIIQFFSFDFFLKIFYMVHKCDEEAIETLLVRSSDVDGGQALIKHWDIIFRVRLLPQDDHANSNQERGRSGLVLLHAPYNMYKWISRWWRRNQTYCPRGIHGRVCVDTDLVASLVSTQYPLSTQYYKFQVHHRRRQILSLIHVIVAQIKTSKHNNDLMLVQRRRRWDNIKGALIQRLLFDRKT